MQLAIHLGAHCTDEDKLLRTLLKNKDMLAKAGIGIPGPGRYRKLTEDMVQRFRGGQPKKPGRTKLRQAIQENDTAHRIVISDEDSICVHGRIFENGLLYDKSSFKPEWIRNVFSDFEVEFFLGIRNPATYVPAAFQHKKQNHDLLSNFLSGVNIADIRWSDIIVSIQESNPGCPITVWCNEDTPFIWGQILRAITGLQNGEPLTGEFAILDQIMSEHGVKRLGQYMEQNPPINEQQKHQIITAFLDKFAVDGAIDEELDMPGWTEDYVEALTEFYEDDLNDIANMPGVTLIEP